MTAVLRPAGLLGRFRRGLSGAVISHFLMIAVQFVMVPVLAGHWGAEAYGTWVLLATIPIYIALGDIGFGMAAGTFMTQRAALGDFSGALSILQTTQAVLAVCSIVILAAGLAVVALLPLSAFAISKAVSSEQARLAAGCLAAYGAVGLLGSVYHGCLRANGDFVYSPVITALTQVAEAIAATVALYTIGTIAGVALAYFLTRIAALIALTAFVLRRVAWARLGLAHARWKDAVAMAHPAFALVALPVAQAVLLQGSVVAVGAAAGASAAATFATVRTLTRSVYQTSLIVGHPLIPEFTAAAIRGETDQKTKILVVVAGSAIVVSTLGMLVLLAIGPQLFAFWTRNAVAASWGLIAVMSCVALLSSSWVPISNLLIAINEQKQFTFIYFAVSAAGVAFTYVLAARLGAAGGAISMLVVEAFMLAVVARAASRLIVPPRALLAGAAALMTDWRGKRWLR